MTKPTYTCATHGRLAPDLVIRDHKRPRCALCGDEATREDASARLRVRHDESGSLWLEEYGRYEPSRETEAAIRAVLDEWLRRQRASGQTVVGYLPAPPGIVSSRTWRSDGTVVNASRLTRLLSEEA